MAEETVQVAEQTPAERVMQLEGTSREKWLETGKLPEVETKSDSSTDAPEKVAEVKKDDKHEQEQPAKKQSRRDQRILELLNENKRLSSELDKSKGGPKTEEKVIEKKAEASTKPILENFKTYEDWVEALTDWKAEQRVTAKFEETEKSRETAAKKAETEKTNKEVEHAFMQRVDESKKAHDDYEEVAFNKDLVIRAGSVVDRWILESEQGAEILYYLGSKPEELERINSLGSIAQARELTKIESSFDKAPEKKLAVTKAPKPPAEINGNGTVAEDPVEDALKKGNFRKYMEEQNAKELKSRRG